MDHLFDEFSKSLAESLPRRESLRRLGAVFAGAVLGPLGLESAQAGAKQRGGKDPCTNFCNCRNRKQQDQCLNVCRGCQSDTSRVCGSCGNYVCCAAGLCQYDCTAGAVDCNGTCTFLKTDPANCGACGNVCAAVTPYCNGGKCSACSAGLTSCSGVCTNLSSDNANCGACGNVCAAATPYCSGGKCSNCAPPL